MKNNIFCTLLILTIFSSFELIAQTKQDFYTFIDLIPLPPSSCEEARSFYNIDSTSSGITIAQRIDTLGKFFDKIYTELSVKSDKIKKSLAEKQEERKGNPDGRFRGEMQGPPDMQDLIEDMHRANEVLVKLNEAEEKFRNEAYLKQKSVNTEIKKAVSKDNDAKRKIIDNFLKDINELYSGFTLELKHNFSLIDDISKKYKYDSEENKPVFRKKILEMQLAESENLILLLSCVKGSAEIGSKFYKK
jgi:hypothetical protein